jgi:hypothetical protein
MSLNESIVEEAALEWFGELGYAVGHGPHLAPVNRRRTGIRSEGGAGGAVARGHPGVEPYPQRQKVALESFVHCMVVSTAEYRMKAPSF